GDRGLGARDPKAQPRLGSAPARARGGPRQGGSDTVALGVYRALKRAGLIDPGARRRRDRRFKRWERGGAMELWQMDVVGGVLLADGQQCKVLTGLDDHSRFAVCAGVMVRATSRAVCAHLAEAMRRHGVTQEILTDHGQVFTGR